MNWLTETTRHLFFTGKGGVGKTSLACAAAVRLADSRKKVLLVSTDPASNLEHVFDTRIGESPTSVPGAEGLEALNIDPEAAARAYRERILGPVRTSLPEKALKAMEEQLSGACTTEIAAFDEFTQLLTDSDQTADYDHIIFDTAPTGHTLRLLKLPAAWTQFIDTNERGASCLGPLSGLKTQRDRYATAVAALADTGQTTLVLVTRPEVGALNEAERTRGELAELGLTNQRLIVNGVLPAAETNGDALAVAIQTRQHQAIENMPAALAALPRDTIALQAHNLLGVDHLRALFEALRAGAGTASEMQVATSPPEVPDLGQLVGELEQDGKGLVMVMGKGGVGKTTIAAAVAVELAARGHDVHLTTTDPAAHVTGAVGDGSEHLTVSRIDPEAETRAYREHVLETKGRELDAEGRALLEEDLKSPCTEEVAVFHAFSRVIREASRRFVVVDTAPTGHTLLLLDTTGAYHREVTRKLSEGVRIVTPMMRLQDPKQTKMLLVTLPETTPVLEAAQLQEDLRRAQIEPWAWVINASLAAAAPSDPLLARRAAAEVSQIEKVRTELAQRTFVVPCAAGEPAGEAALRRLMHQAGSQAPQSAR